MLYANKSIPLNAKTNFNLKNLYIKFNVITHVQYSTINKFKVNLTICLSNYQDKCYLIVKRNTNAFIISQINLKFNLCKCTKFQLDKCYNLN